MSIEIEAKRSSLSVTTYGIHSMYRKRLEDIIQNEFGTRSVYIYEYLFDTPVVKADTAQSITTFAPFLRRILSELTFTPIYNGDIKSSDKVDFAPHSFDNIVKFWTAENNFGASASLEKTTILRQIFSDWETNNMQNSGEDFHTKKDDEYIIGNWRYKIDYLESKYLNVLSELNEIEKSCFLKEYYTVVYPWTQLSGDQYLNIGAISLSSENIFYGILLVFYPQLEKMQERDIFSNPVDQNKGESQFLIELKSIIRESYLPILLLHENLWKEREIDEVLKDNEIETEGKKIEKLKEIINFSIFFKNSLKNTKNQLELSLAELWKERGNLFETNADKIIWSPIKALGDSLIFAKYSIASHGMIDEIKKVMIKRSANNNYLPSVLVIGSPGSGKDRLARAISLFYPKYRFGKRYTLNMASIKPTSFSVPLLSGVNINGSDFSINLDGIFQRIVNDYAEDKNFDKPGFLPVIILDELNSLDIDAQGALLRILENKELQPLGDINVKKVDFLVIGIVNEPEKILTLHEPLQKFLTDNTLFGGVLGKVFYEYFRGMRRLREDIYFRMIRDGKIELPKLADRRADIPMLFKVFLENELDEELVKHSKLWIDYDVFDELMNDSIPWNGNFRELQSMTKRIGQKAAVDPINSDIYSIVNTKNKFYRISRNHVKAALDEMKIIGN